MTINLHTEEVAEVRPASEAPRLPPLPPAALRSRLQRAAVVLESDPGEATRILTAPPSPSGLGEA